MAIAALLTQLAIDGVMSHSKGRVHEAKKQWGLIVAGAASGIIALCFLTAALYMGLTMVLSTALAALTTGLIISIVSMSCLYYAQRAESREAEKENESAVSLPFMNGELGEALESLFADIERPVKDNPGTSVLLATLAGFLTADRMH